MSYKLYKKWVKYLGKKIKYNKLTMRCNCVKINLILTFSIVFDVMKSEYLFFKIINIFKLSKYLLKDKNISSIVKNWHFHYNILYI